MLLLLLLLDAQVYSVLCCSDRSGVAVCGSTCCLQFLSCRQKHCFALEVMAAPQHGVQWQHMAACYVALSILTNYNDKGIPGFRQDKCVVIAEMTCSQPDVFGVVVLVCCCCCRDRVAAALGVDPQHLELSMGMSGDFEQAVGEPLTCFVC